MRRSRIAAALFIALCLPANAYDFQVDQEYTDKDAYCFPMGFGSNIPYFGPDDAGTVLAWCLGALRDNAFVVFGILGGDGVFTIRHGTSTAHLGWTAPNQNADGTPLTDLAGYRVYSGLDPDNMILMAETNLTYWFTEPLNEGTWYFAVTAFDTTGNESVKSSLVFKDIEP